MSSPFSIDLNEDQNHHFDHFSSQFADDYYASSSSNSTCYPIFNITPSSHQFPFYQSHFLQPSNHQNQGENTYVSQGGSLDHPSIENENGDNISVCKEVAGRESNSVKWMSSKMRLMKKMMKSDQTAGSSSNQMIKFEVEKGQSSSLDLEDQTAANNLPNNPIRVCSDCNTTKTPLWRSGPRGPKSLCNACGIRQRKARRALAAAQESGNGAICDTTSSSFIKNKPQDKAVKKMSTTAATPTTNNSHLPFKKRCKFMAQSRGRKKKKLCFEDLSAVILSKNNAAFHQVFPQDEKEAAILLMALSYGLACG